jgi:hypothetical protein
MAHSGLRALSALAVSCSASIAYAGSGYALVSTFELPEGIDTFSVAPSGLIYAASGSDILIQNSINSGSFSLAGSLPSGLINSFGASFISVSPDGQTIAVGDNNIGSEASVLLLPAAALKPGSTTPATAIASPNFSAAWGSNSTLFVTGGDFGSPSVVTEINTATATASVVIDNIDGASGGIAVSNGRLYTGNGFSYGGGSLTGDVFAFELANLGTAPVAFADGTLVANALSAGSLSFDAAGNLLVGGGNFSGEIGFVSVIDSLAVENALAGGPIATSADGQMLAPIDDPSAFYSVRFNPVTEELYVTTFGNSTVFVYAIPTPGGAALLALTGLAACRRRRA